MLAEDLAAKIFVQERGGGNKIKNCKITEIE